MSDLAGSLKKVTLDGISFDVFNDSNVKEVGSGWENSAIPTSGRTMRKMMKRVEERENIVVACNGAERAVLKRLSERLDDFPMSYVTAGGDIFRCIGFIEFESRETEELRATLKMIPRGQWEPFLAA